MNLHFWKPQLPVFYCYFTALFFFYSVHLLLLHVIYAQKLDSEQKVMLKVTQSRLYLNVGVFRCLDVFQPQD